MTEQAPYGSWPSPISASDLAGSVHPVDGGAFVGDDVWWAELRSAEGGRYAIRRTGPGGQPIDVLPAPWNARSRVHEYGGGAWAATRGRALVFVEFSDQRLYTLAEGGTPRPLTPADAGFRFGELSIVGDRVLAVREVHTESELTRDIVTVPLDGSAADAAENIVQVVSGSHFLAYPRQSPDGTKLAWIAWEHPQMPWDGTELRVGDLTAPLEEGGTVGEWATVAGSTDESVLQPEWDGTPGGSEALFALSDRTGFWNLYRVSLPGKMTLVSESKADVGGPLWTLGRRWYQQLDDGRIVTVNTFGNDHLCILDPDTGELNELDTPFTTVGLCDMRGSRLLLVSASAQLTRGLRILNNNGRIQDVRRDVDQLPDTGYLSEARPMTFKGPKREVHAFVYPPTNPKYVGLPGEKPPYIAFVHGGPTSHVQAAPSLTHAYYTSRGIGVIDVNYGGSTGYGREYRNRLRGQWGVVDVEDTVQAVLGLAKQGMADPSRLGIEGGSAGGWTVLASLTSTDVFAAGVSYFGVAELTAFVTETHDFESRYVDGLIGPLPASAELYEKRAPLNNVAGLNAPVLLLQGLDDPIVPPAQAERFRDALVAKGIPHAYIAYEGESHGFRRADTVISAHEASLSFYGQVFGFTPPDVPELPLWRPTEHA